MGSMRLFSRIIGRGPAIVVLHGLFGMSDNWVSIANELADHGFTVHLVDLRNHGRSPHAATHRYPDMCEDLLAYLDDHGLESVRVIGHSMGGKLAMMFGLLEPERLNRLVVVDIAPSDYRDPTNTKNTFNTTIVETLRRLDPAAHASRLSVREKLTEELGDPAIAMFLTKSLQRAPGSKKLEWKFNLAVLDKFLQHIHIGLEELEIYAPCLVPTLFVRGEHSRYCLPKHESDRTNFFPHSDLVSIDGAGHWVHSEQPEKFLQAIIPFLLEEAMVA